MRSKGKKKLSKKYSKRNKRSKSVRHPPKRRTSKTKSKSSLTKRRMQRNAITGGGGRTKYRGGAQRNEDDGGLTEYDDNDIRFEAPDFFELPSWKLFFALYKANIPESQNVEVFEMVVQNYNAIKDVNEKRDAILTLEYWFMLNINNVFVQIYDEFDESNPNKDALSYLPLDAYKQERHKLEEEMQAIDLEKAGYEEFQGNYNQPLRSSKVPRQQFSTRQELLAQFAAMGHENIAHSVQPPRFAHPVQSPRILASELPKVRHTPLYEVSRVEPNKRAVYTNLFKLLLDFTNTVLVSLSQSNWVIGANGIPMFKVSHDPRKT